MPIERNRKAMLGKRLLGCRTQQQQQQQQQQFR
jgi:hypothetical protein